MASTKQYLFLQQESFKKINIIRYSFYKQSIVWSLSETVQKIYDEAISEWKSFLLEGQK